METGSATPTAAGGGGFSSSFLRRDKNPPLATASIPQRPDVLTSLQPSSVLSSVRRKPLPYNASPVIFQELSEGDWSAASPRPSETSPPSPVVDTTFFLPRDLDR